MKKEENMNTKNLLKQKLFLFYKQVLQLHKNSIINLKKWM